MFFTVFDSNSVPTPRIPCKAFLYGDGWDDWGKYRTKFSLYVTDESGTPHNIGSVKIGKKGLLPSSKVSPNHRTPELPSQFEKLSKDFFSLGQNEDYYASLNKLSYELRSRVLKGLRDCAADLNIFESYLNEDVMGESLLRNVRRDNVYGRFNRLSRGDAKLTKYEFTYTFPTTDDEDTSEIDFEVIPDSQPPTNVHVLIGRNGVGKTHCMRHLALSLLHRTDNEQSPGEISMTAEDTGENFAFSGLVLVSFSAFDDFDLTPAGSDSMVCHQVGLRASASSSKGTDDLASEFAISLWNCRDGVKADRWKTAVATLEEDDLFEEANVVALIEKETTTKSQWTARAKKLFKRLSSGHAIVLITITRLVELVDERTIVLLDEPEGHLHPPLLSSFIRCLSDLLIRRNGVAIIATHSPVVLQEVPKSCTWKLRRSHTTTVVERPTIETFGENIGVLTREVFGLQVTQSGFHRLLKEAVIEGSTYKQILGQFNNQLGNEAKSIIQALVIARDEESNA